MSDFLENLNRAIERRFRGPAFSKFLGSCGIDPKRYWLLMDLFAMLSKREEMQGQLGRQGAALRFSAGLFFVLSSVASVFMVVVGVPVWVFISIYVVFTLFVLLGILLSETANSLVNPVEALVLAHQPINGATYSGAKLSHLLRIVLYFVAGMNLTPSLAGVFLRDAPWFYPFLHFGGALACGLLLAFACCGIFGWLMKIVPARRMKAASQFVQGIPFLLLMSRRAWMPGARRIWGWLQGPLRFVPDWAEVAIPVALILIAVVSGLRTLSSDYLIRVSTMVHSASNAKTRVRRSYLGDIVRRFFGGQAGRAGFDYMRRMMTRDWQFRRQMLTVVPLLIFAVLGFGNAAVSKNPSPFARGFSPVHALPHVIGVVVLVMCQFLQYGTDYKGIWLFLLVPDRALYRFAQGVHASLWLTFAVIPHLLLTSLFIWRWGILDASLFVIYSAAAVTIYLAVGMRSIGGVPFGKQLNPTRTAGMQFGMILTVLLVALAVGFQYLTFRFHLVVEILIPFVCVAAYLLTRHSLSTLEAAIRHNLALESGASKLIYTEIEAN